MISNIVGNIIKKELLSEPSGKLSIDVNAFENGIYFYSLVINNKTIITRKLIVKN